MTGSKAFREYLWCICLDTRNLQMTSANLGPQKIRRIQVATGQNNSSTSFRNSTHPSALRSVRPAGMQLSRLHPALTMRMWHQKAHQVGPQNVIPSSADASPILIILCRRCAHTAIAVTQNRVSLQCKARPFLSSLEPKAESPA